MLMCTHVCKAHVIALKWQSVLLSYDLICSDFKAYVEQLEVCCCVTHVMIVTT